MEQFRKDMTKKVKMLIIEPGCRPKIITSSVSASFLLIWEEIMCGVKFVGEGDRWNDKLTIQLKPNLYLTMSKQDDSVSLNDSTLLLLGNLGKSHDIPKIENTKGKVFIYQTNEKPEETECDDEPVDISNENQEFVYKLLYTI